MMAPGIWARRRYLAGTDEHRSKQLLWAFMHDEIRGIMCLRGGYGSMRVLPTLDGRALRANAKVFVGYSDLTAILVYLLDAAGVVAFHGPTLTSLELSEGSQTTTSRSLFRNIMEGIIPEPIAAEGWCGGVAEGVLTGGCLSIITALVGTPFAPRLEDSILFLEDTNEPVYRIDRMLRHLALAGVFSLAKGVVLGAMGTGTRKDQLRQIVNESLVPHKVPVLFGVPSGHGSINLTLPLGTRVRLDGNQGKLFFLESGVEGEL
jgi:muramoyltetrapeptide carboxypeptidase